ncbi:MAG: hypothetical protein HY364_04815, partial [Candidatus Aenigmarchaeota archaeon]|nr:hypothetical protein [Candidatus Aenigmarchaeota archaeon]
MKKISFIATVTISLVWLAHAGFAGCVSSDNYDPDIFYCTTGDTLSCDGVLNHECYEIGDRGNAFYYDYCRFNSFDGLYHCYMSAEAPPDDPPTAFITVPSTATAGQSITLYGSGTDETDINRITAYYQGAYRSQDCTGTQTTCSKSWSITESSAGTYTYYIYVYDNAGHESSPASATVTWSAPAATTTTTTTSSTTTTLPGATCTEGLVCISGDAYYQYSDCRRDIDERCNGRG